MMLENIYNEFVQHTKLTDSVYKTVFANIGNILNYIKDIQWESLTYTRNLGGDDEERSVFDFKAFSEFPLYVVELFRNVFENFYEIPVATVVELNLTYAGVPYKIQTYEGITIFPEQVKFIKQYKLYELFITDTRVIDLFSAFDKCFSFINTFKTTPRDIYTPLLKRFENVSATTQVRENIISENKNAGTQLRAEEINQRIAEVMTQLSGIRVKQEVLSNQRKSISDGVKAYDYLAAERYQISIETETLTETQKAYANEIKGINDVLAKIDLNISDLNARPDTHPTKVADLDFMIKKKTIFERNKLAQETSLRDVSLLVTDLSGRLRIIVEKLAEIGQYSVTDLDKIEFDLKRLDGDGEKLYTLLLSLEAEMKQQKHMASTNSLSLAKAENSGAYGDITLQNIENANIIDHLAAPMHPASVTTVANYLRYYFVFNATLIAEKLLSDKVIQDTYIAQAIALKLVLCRYFGVYFYQMFSPIHFSDNRIERLIKISKS